MSPASSGQPRPAAAYALWLDSLTRAGWEAGPAAEQVPVADALGRVSAEPIVARWPSPRSDCSAMDGIAVRAAGLTAAATAATAADGSAVRLPAGTFEWIDTGDPMPAGADTVVMREWLLPQEDGGVIIVPGGLTAAGADATSTPRTGDPAATGSRCRWARTSGWSARTSRRGRTRPGRAAAAAGRPGRRRGRRASPRCWSRGSRWSRSSRPGTRSGRSGSTARPGEILDTNSLMLAARCRQLSAVPALSEIQPDDPDALAAEIRRCAHEADLVLVIAGSSRGRGDHAAAVLAQVGGVAVTGVAVRPGHPALLGHAKHPGSAARSAASGRAGIAPVIGLPGYPLASTVIFELFAAPLLAALQGVRPAARPALLAALDRDWSSPPGIEDWVLVTLAPAAASPAAGRCPSPPRPGAGPGRSASSPAPTPGGRSRPTGPPSPPARPSTSDPEAAAERGPWPSRNGGEPLLAVLVQRAAMALRYRPTSHDVAPLRSRAACYPPGRRGGAVHAYRSQSLAFAHDSDMSALPLVLRQ